MFIIEFSMVLTFKNIFSFSNYTYVGTLNNAPHVSQFAFIFLHPFFFLCFSNFKTSIDQSLRLLNLFTCQFTSNVETLHQLLFFSTPKFHLVLFNNYLLIDIFCLMKYHHHNFLYFFKHSFRCCCSLNIIIIATLKSLSAKMTFQTPQKAFSSAFPPFYMGHSFLRLFCISHNIFGEATVQKIYCSKSRY